MPRKGGCPRFAQLLVSTGFVESSLSKSQGLMVHASNTTRPFLRSPRWSPGRKLALLCAAHLGLACLSTAVSSYNRWDPLSLAQRVLVETIFLGAIGVQLGQVA